MVTVCCPKCGTEREIIGTEERVRCANKDDCGKRYYIKGNIVPEERDIKDKNGTNYSEASGNITVSTRTEDLYIGQDLDRNVLIAGLMDTIKIYKNKVLNKDGKILKKNSIDGKKVLEWVERYENQKWVPMLVVHQAYFQKVDLAYKELNKLRL